MPRYRELREALEVILNASEEQVEALDDGPIAEEIRRIRRLDPDV